MERIFKIRCSAISKIMGSMGLTETQQLELDELFKRVVDGTKPLTKNMEIKLNSLSNKSMAPELPQTAKTYLEEWYSNENEFTFSKYTEKGLIVEDELIDFAANVLGYGIAEKNKIRLEDDYITGECDVNLSDVVIDVKAPWNKKTFYDHVLNGLTKDYEAQLKGYCHLYKKPKGILFYGLMDTPADVNYDKEVIYSDMPDNQRWVAYTVNEDKEFINQVIERVKLCRKYLVEHDLKIKNKIGRLN